MNARPLAVVAKLRGAVCLPNGPIALDGLLAAAVAVRDNMPPPSLGHELVPIEIPIEREPGGRFHLASCGEAEPEEHEMRWLNRRFPLSEAQGMANAKLRTINLQGGPCKSYRLPLETFHAKGDMMRWWCLGDAAEVRALLDLIGYVGKRRATGLGHVEEWTVVECEPWEGFPVVRDGLPLRHLPVDWPGLVSDVEQQFRVISYPYWQHEREELLAVPSW